MNKSETKEVYFKDMQMKKGGIVISLPQVAKPGGNKDLLNRVVKEMRKLKMSAAPMFRIEYLWRLDENGRADIWFYSEAELSYYQFGMSVTEQVFNLV